MNKVIKVAFLVITLAIPVGIFLFLKVFGNNKFDIPVYYQEAGTTTDCGELGADYTIPDSLKAEGKGQLVFFYQPSIADPLEISNQFVRLKDTFNDQMPTFVLYSSKQVEIEGVPTTVYNRQTYDKVLNCAYAAEYSGQYVSVDKLGRIRGYYATDLDEQDRLIVELKILNENGEN
ncbi:hypothetical protein [Fulvivirga ligni]|uniref:hypothetical protein n=1 Tax=Fulvivirga ligni TaxID=2904246 RepID=UPI001F3A756D|nr:hypothetical protein [Fulvivirga ligni]UII24154.1 hypothetical protein LVD16_13100 [Fulvivirga ligni]